MRVRTGFKARRRRKKVLKLAKGYRGGRSKLYRTAADAVDKALCTPTGIAANANVISGDFGSQG